MADPLFWFIAIFTLTSAAFVVFNNQLLYSAIALLFTLFGQRLMILRDLTVGSGTGFLERDNDLFPQSFFTHLTEL